MPSDRKKASQSDTSDRTTEGRTKPSGKVYSYVRMSTKEQLEGDSLDRQYKRTRNYAQTKGLELVEDYEDIGISGFTGLHKQGELGLFLEALKDKKVPVGSYLVVESMDRLSRLPPLEAMELFSEIIKKGVILATLDDGMEYSQSDFALNQHKLYIALGQMMRAHGESLRKSGLISAVWQSKRDKLSTKRHIFTGMIPAWLEVNRSSNQIEPIPERVAIIKEIFDLTCNGFGIYSVARLLNDRREPAWGTTRRTKLRAKRAAKPIWRDSYIKKIVTNRSVLGEFQPHKVETTDQKKRIRKPTGEAIHGYYPQVISQEVFRDAQLAMSRRSTGARGRKGAAYSNLFTGIVHCECKSRMRFLDKGAKDKDSKYLRCSVALVGGGCTHRTFRYEPVEQVILDSLEQLDIQKILSGDAVSTRLRDKKQFRELKRMDLESVNQQVNNINRHLAQYSGKLPDSTFEMLRDLQRDQAALSAAINASDAEIDELLAIDPAKRKLVLDQLMVAIGDNDVEKRCRARRALAAELQRTIHSITLRQDFEAHALRDPTEVPWTERLPDVEPAKIEQHLKDYGFEAVIRFRNDDLQTIRGLDLRSLKLKSNVRFKRMKAVRNFESK